MALTPQAKVCASMFPPTLTSEKLPRGGDDSPSVLSAQHAMAPAYRTAQANESLTLTCVKLPEGGGRAQGNGRVSSFDFRASPRAGCFAVRTLGGVVRTKEAKSGTDRHSVAMGRAQG